MEQCRHCTEGCILGDNAKRDVGRYLSKAFKGTQEPQCFSWASGIIILFAICISFLYWVSNCKLSSTCVCVCFA